MNPLFQALGGMQSQQMNGFGQMIQQFRQFQRTFQGDAKAEVMRMLQSGRINQQQLDQVQAIAREFQALL